MSNIRNPVKLSMLLEGLADLKEDTDRLIHGVVQDSREVHEGFLFCALAGTRFDGRHYVNAARAAGAHAVVYDGDKPADLADLDVPVIKVPNLRRHLGEIADRFFNWPSKKIKIIGITGTNGKTSCAHLIAQALNALNKRCAVIGTLGVGFPDKLRASPLTTPDAVSLRSELAQLIDDEVDYTCIEISSHAMDQGRVDGLHFSAAVFTNLTHDHLDYHGNMEAYRDAKLRLFSFPGLERAAINVSDTHSAKFLDVCTAPKITTFGADEGEVRITLLEVTRAGLSMEVQTSSSKFKLQPKLYGRVNAVNVVAVVAVLLIFEFDKDQISRAVSKLTPVPGRMETFLSSRQYPIVVVDYAHTPDAIERALQSLREHTEGQLWCVFGCGGDRDRSKRPVMGGIVERLADQVVITDDNPRNEDPVIIVDEIQRGMQVGQLVIHDRRAAIAHAIKQAYASDSVLVAGKGHEQTQQVKGQYLPMSDRRIVSDLMGIAA